MGEESVQDLGALENKDIDGQYSSATDNSQG